MSPPIKIALGRGLFALADADDAGLILAHQWTLRFDGLTAYAVASSYAGRQDLALMHRMILRPDVGQRLDHINGNGLDNRRVNLRDASAAENSRNRFKTTSATTSRFKGVYWDTDVLAWCACIGFEGAKHALGAFEREEDAARAYDETAIRMFGEFARTNETLGLYPGMRPQRPLSRVGKGRFRRHKYVNGKTADEVWLEKQIARHEAVEARKARALAAR